MLARIVGFDRQKGARADMQGEDRQADAAPSECLDQRRGEMQPGGRRGNSALGAGEHRLIIGPVARVAAAGALDVGRQRHHAMTRQRLAERRPLQIEAQGHVALGMLVRHPRREILGEVETVAGMQPAGALGKGAPRAAAFVMMQGYLDSRSATFSDKTSRHYLRVVADQQIARPQQIRQIENMPVGETSLCRDMQQARRLARLAGMIRDQFARQREIEIVEAHRTHRPR